MTQPKWKYLTNLGDASPLEHGGYFIFEDETGVYAPEAEYLEVKDDGTGTAYRFSLDKCTYIDGVLSDNKFHPDHPAWFADHLPHIADSFDMTVAEVAAKFCSDDVLERAWAYREVGSYYGFDNFDNYPLELSEEEMQIRYANIGFGELPKHIQDIREMKAEVQKKLDRISDTSDDPFYRGHDCGYRSALMLVMNMLSTYDTHSVGASAE
jgi:hypothetical protein